MFFSSIIEEADILGFLESRGLTKQYKKAKNYLLSGYFHKVNFKLRQPKEKGVYSFRINKQFRAFGIVREQELRVFRIDNHQS